jgi:hypothetical protein
LPCADECGFAVGHAIDLPEREVLLDDIYLEILDRELHSPFKGLLYAVECCQTRVLNSSRVRAQAVTRE